MSNFFEKKSEKEYIKDKAEADKIIEALDNKIYQCKEQLRDKDNELNKYKDENKKLKDELEECKKENKESEDTLERAHYKLKEFMSLKTKYKKLTEKYNLLKYK